jgi:hypothetical protein
MFKLNKLAVAVASAALLGALSSATQAADLGVTHVFEDGSIMQSFDDGSIVAFDSTGSIVASLGADETADATMITYTAEAVEAGMGESVASIAFDDSMATMSQYVFDDGSIVQSFEDGSLVALDSSGDHVASLGPDDSIGAAERTASLVSDEVAANPGHETTAGLTLVYNCVGNTCAEVARYEG